MKLRWFWLDDIRPAPYNFMISVRDYRSMINIINMCDDYDIPFAIHFDHDLGETKSGYDVAKYIVENQIPMKVFGVHSMNPVGTENIRDLLTHYGYIEK